MNDDNHFLSVSSRAKEKLRRDLGQLIENALDDKKTIEVIVNPDGSLWIERLGEPMKRIGLMSPSRVESIIKTVAGFHNREITREAPLLECELPLDGSRFAAQLPPVVTSPCFVIRKKAIAIFSLNDYVDANVMSVTQKARLSDAVQSHKNILVIGGTGSGKTTLINALINEMVDTCPNERMVIIEDTGEIQCAAKNVIQYHTTRDITMTLLIKATLRMRPDRILVGEVRGEEALDLLDAWNTGHEGGVATLHANNAKAALKRLKSLVTRNPFAPDDIDALIGEVVQLIVHIAKTPEGRRIKDILAIDGFKDGQYQLQHYSTN